MRQMIGDVRLTAVFLILGLIFTGCAPTQKGAKVETLTLALASPMTGPVAALGVSARAGMMLAMEEINQAGGIRGKELRLQIEDDKGDPKEAATVARKLVADQSVLAVVGHLNSSCTLAGAPIYNRGRLVELSYGSTNPKITEAGEWTFRNCVTDAFQGDFDARYAIQRLKKKKFAVLYDNDDYGRGLMEVFTAAVKKYGGRVLAIEAYARGQSTDFTAQLTKIKGLDPDAIFISGISSEGALIAQQARQLGIKSQLLGADGLFSDDLVKLGGKAVEGIVFSGFFHYTSSNPKAQRLVETYRQRFAKDLTLPRDPDAWVAQTYDAVYLLKEAMEKGGQTRRQIRDYLATIGITNPAFEGVTGRNAFDRNGDMQKVLLMVTVKNGKIIAQ